MVCKFEHAAFVPGGSVSVLAVISVLVLSHHKEVASTLLSLAAHKGIKGLSHQIINAWKWYQSKVLC